MRKPLVRQRAAVSEASLGTRGVSHGDCEGRAPRTGEWALESWWGWSRCYKRAFASTPPRKLERGKERNVDLSSLHEESLPE